VPWFGAYRVAEGFGDHEANMRRAILGRIRAPTAYAQLLYGNTPVAIGLGVVEDGYLGIFSMATFPAYRRQGAATMILHALGCWARERGASNAYLQVMVQNKPAQALYARAGFVTLYDYHYRELRPD
jgi:GNAT superfamily N-acetyltransferase